MICGQFNHSVMKLVFVTLMLALFLTSTPKLAACSYYGGVPAKSVSEIYDESDVVIRGTVQYIDVTGSEFERPNRIVVLDITERFKAPADLPDKIRVHYIFAGDVLGGCSPNSGTHFVTGESYTLFLKIEKKRFEVLHTSGEYGLTYFYDETQIYDYLLDRMDSPLKSNFCLFGTDMREAYKGSFLDSVDVAPLSDKYRYAECVYQPIKSPTMPKLQTQ